MILAKKFTVANYVNFSHTYGQPIIHGKTVSESNADRKRLANEIANAAQNKVVVTGIEDEVDIKTFTMSNSEKIYTGLIEFVNKEVANLVLGSESMAGGMQSYVGSTKAHQDIFRDRIEVYRRYIENIMNEEIIPRLVAIGYIPGGLEFRYSNRIEMSNEDRIKLYSLITDKYEVAADEIEKEFGINVGRQLNVIPGLGFGAEGGSSGLSHNDRGIMSDEEYFRRYGRPGGEGRKFSAGSGIEARLPLPDNAPFRAVRASATTESDTEKEYRVIFDAFRRLILYWENSAERLDIIEDIITLRASFLIDRALTGLRIDMDRALEILKITTPLQQRGNGSSVTS